MTSTKTRTVPPAGAFIVDTKIARSTGAQVSVLNLNAPSAIVEKGEDGEAWAAQCLDHGWTIWTPTRREAHAEATCPEEWCKGCEATGVVFVGEFDVA